MMTFTEIAHDRIRSVLRRGDVAIDATVGNGHDTTFLAECVGLEGVVYGFDIQRDALERTAQRLTSLDLNNVRLLNRSHAEMQTALADVEPGRVRAVMFNLGYLPGGDKSITTRVESTIAAIQAGLMLLGAGGVMTVLAYVGHAGGSDEALAVEQLVGQLAADEFDVCKEAPPSDRTSAPRLFVVRRRETVQKAPDA